MIFINFRRISAGPEVPYMEGRDVYKVHNLTSHSIRSISPILFLLFFQTAFRFLPNFKISI